MNLWRVEYETPEGNPGEVIVKANDPQAALQGAREIDPEARWTHAIVSLYALAV